MSICIPSSKNNTGSGGGENYKAGESVGSIRLRVQISGFFFFLLNQKKKRSNSRPLWILTPTFYARLLNYPNCGFDMNIFEAV